MLSSSWSSRWTLRTVILGVLFVLFHAGITTAQQTKIDLDCQAEWTLQGIHCYRLYPEALPWETAERVCMSYGGHLATPFDYYENEEVGSVADAAGVPQYWLGANRIGTPPNDQRVLKYSGGLEVRMWVGHWYIHHPKLTEGECVYVVKDRKQLHKWTLGPCEKKMPFVCQRPVCSKGSFHCVSGKCINPKVQCDGYNDCGDRSDEIDCAQNCSSTIQAVSPTSVINYPELGGNYPDNADCLWRIEADVGYSVELEVPPLSLEDGFDELIIMDGGLTEGDSMEIASLTGQLTGPMFYYSSNNMMIVKFRSDGSGNAAGFQLRHRQVKIIQETSTPLTATITRREQEFPYYNQRLPGNQDHVYIIEAQDSAQTVTLEILDLELPADAELVIRDGGTIRDDILARLTRTYRGSSSFSSSGRHLYVALHTVRGSSSRGVKFAYRQGCGADLVLDTGYITSPGFPASNYPNNIICNWNVTIPSRRDVTVIFIEMEVDSADTLEIQTSVTRFTGTTLPAPLRITDDSFRVQFTSSSMGNDRGFNMTFSIDCPSPNISVSLSDITGTVSEAYGSSFRVSCKTGSQFFQEEHMGKTEVTMTCGPYGKWNVNTSPTCQRILCPRAPDLQNGYIERSVGGLGYQGTVTYSCYSGFALSGPRTITCNINGQWSSMPTCQASGCGRRPEPPAEGNITSVMGNGTSYGTIVKYSCFPGFDLLGSPSIFCDSSNSWTGNAPTCQIQSCYTNNITNGDLSAQTVNVGQTITLTCRAGYATRPPGISTMSCNTNRQLEPKLTCENINECLNSQTCAGTCIDTPGSYRCECPPGFMVDGSRCTDIDECSPNKPCDGNCRNTPGSYECSCAPGFSLYVMNGTEGHFLPLNEDGTLPGDKYRLNHSCVPVQCQSPPPSYSNAELLSAMTKYHFNDRITYKCNLGFVMTLSGAGNLTCAADKTWSGPAISCVAATCQNDDPNAANRVIQYGEEVVKNCSVPGFVPPNFTRIRRCTLIGGVYKLDGSLADLDCGSINCGKPQQEPSSIYTGLTTTSFGSTFTFGCESQFQLSGASNLTQNTTVTCQGNRQWDFGSLQCIGKQCKDPGQPHLGEQVSSDYRNGQLVTFNCTLPGYELSPPYPISCEVTPLGTQFNASVPQCVDVQSPEIVGCPFDELVVEKGVSSIVVVTPLYSDNGGIRSISVSPAPPSRHYYINNVRPPVVFTYTLTDYGGNQATCSKSVRAEDDITPVIDCADPLQHIFITGNDRITVPVNDSLVNVTDDISPRNKILVTFGRNSYNFIAASMALPSFPPTHYNSIVVTAEDEAGNKAMCNVAVFFKADVCSPLHLRQPPNSDKICVPSGNGYSCTITCRAGFKFYHNVNQDSATVTCPQPGVQFSPAIDFKCVDLSTTSALEGSYKLEYEYVYTGNNISDSNECQSEYETIISNVLQLLSDDETILLPEFCSQNQAVVTGKIVLGKLNISRPEQKVRVLYQILFDRKPNSLYTNCANAVALIMESPSLNADMLVEYTPPRCSKITLNQQEITEKFKGYYCEEDNPSTLGSTDGNAEVYCLRCPEGTYSASSDQCLPCPRGTYRPVNSSSDQCQPCPPDSSTYEEGAFDSSECTAICSSGTVSPTGLPPCIQCPLDTYSANATTCVPCPAGTKTKQRGANNEDECRKKCSPGNFNEFDGHENCRPCPRHHYASQSGARACTECAPNEYTMFNGSAAASDCLPLSGFQECNRACQNGRCQNILPHVTSCICNDGWTGEYCSRPLDPCESRPCFYGGACSQRSDSYFCTCPIGTSGRNCESIIETCTDNYCQNNGMCQNLVNSAKCHCLPGFSGDKCETTRDICASGPCKNGGTCTNLGNIRYSCNCPASFTGPDCSESKDDCYLRPCRNNGTCMDQNNDYLCNCDSNFDGKNCSIRKQKCPSACGLGVRCVEDEVNQSFICLCNEYAVYSPATQSCEPIDFCASNPCENGATCTKTSTSFSCGCLPGYAGSTCQHNINDCMADPCQNGGTCVDGINSSSCNCNAGYTGAMCETNIDDCIPNPCRLAGTLSCVDMVNQFRCECKQGYRGQFCEEDINDCVSRPCLHGGVCVDRINDYACGCPTGWTGKNCETEVNNCATAPCANGATCATYFRGFFCNCRPNTFGNRCSSVVDICRVADPCVAGDCTESNGAAVCSCRQGYTGDRCNMQTYFCSENGTVCENDAQCIPQLDNYDCICQPGYTGMNCEVNTNECLTKACPAIATCKDMEDHAYCRCPLDMEGPNCNRPWDQNFDLLFDDQERIGMAYLPYPIELKSDAFSIALWVQFGEKDGKGTILSLMTVPKSNSLRGKMPLLWMDENTVYYNDNGNMTDMTHNTIYNDGKWHYLVVSVDRRTGELQFIVSTVRRFLTISTGTFDVNLWLQLGSKYDPVTDMPVKGEGFRGKLSRVTVYSRALSHREEVTILGNTNVSALFSDSILRWSSEFRYTSGVRRLAPSGADDNSCQFGSTNYPACDQFQPGKNTIMVRSCPNDTIQYSPDRSAQVSWSVPTFSGQLDNIQSSVTSGDILEWGKYHGIVEAFNSDGNKALCLFNIYVQSDQCTNPKTPPNAVELQCSPNDYEKYKQCALICQNNYAPSMPSPVIHTCGPVGNWDPLKRFVPYRITPCGEVTPPKRQLIIDLRYNVPSDECSAVKQAIETELRKTQVSLNGMWDRVCTQSDCSDTQIIVKCSTSRRKRQAGGRPLTLVATLILSDIAETIRNRNNGTDVRTEDLYEDLISGGAPGNPFDYSAIVSDAIPVLSDIATGPQCIAPNVLIENECVACGPGTFYNETGMECQFCPMGSFQPLSGQRNCTPCPDGFTTEQPGEFAGCNEKCRAGQYFDTTEVKCKNCSVGYFQPQEGQFYCLACPADKTTKFTGTVLERDCSNDCPPGQEIGVNNTCSNCEIGFYRGTGETFCKKCPNGLVTNFTSSTSVSDCNVADNPAGTFRDPNNPTNFSACPIGFYQDRKWQFSCIKCRNDYTTEKEGSKFDTDCEFFCPPGEQKKQGLDECEPCPKGTYRDGSNILSSCMACPGSKTTLQDGSISVANCSIHRCGKGEQPNANNDGCDPCPQGSYQENEDQPSCDKCGPDTSTRGDGATDQSECETYCPSGQEKTTNGTCEICGIGDYKDNTLNVFMNCTRCQNTSYVTPNMGSISNDNCTLLDCKPGSIIDGDRCVLCPEGSYQELPRQNSCVQCDPGRFTENEGATSKDDCLLNCTVGQENVNSSDTCTPCKVGYYKDTPGTTKCKPCADDLDANDILISPTTGATSNASCTELVCGKGYYPVNNTCTACGYESYQPDRWQANCLMCAPGLTTYMQGAIDASACEQNCSVGQALVNGACEPCSIGSYNDKMDPQRKECIACPSGFITPAEGATSSSQCNIVDCSTPGQYRDPADNQCKRCPIGTYQDTPRQEQCKNCSGGTTTEFDQSSSAADCKKDCPRGTQLNEASNTCDPCPMGTFRDKQDGSWTCVNCPNSLTTPAIGATDSTNCSVSTCNPGFVYSMTQSNCVRCPLNTYMDQAQQSGSCKPCPANKVTASTGSASVSDCKSACNIGSKCDTVTEDCKDIDGSSGFTCVCKTGYIKDANGVCGHKCDQTPEYCGENGECERNPFQCRCNTGFTGVQCEIREPAKSQSDDETETIVIAVVTTLAGILLLCLILVCLYVMTKRRSNNGNSKSSDYDEPTSIATRSTKGADDIPTFAVNPVFSSRPPSALGTPNGGLASQSFQTYDNSVYYSADEDNDPAVYRA